MKKVKNLKAFVGFSQTVDDAYENLEEYNPIEKRKVLIVFVDMIADTETNKNSNKALYLLPLGNKMSWDHRNNVSLYVPATSQLRLK